MKRNGRDDWDDGMFGEAMDGFGDLMFYFAIFGVFVVPVLLLIVAIIGTLILGSKEMGDMAVTL